MWQTCTKGHDLTGEDAWLYTSANNRECRQCVYERSARKARRPYGWDTAIGNKWIS